DHARAILDYALRPQQERGRRPMANEIVSGGIGDAFSDQPAAKLLCGTEDRANGCALGYIFVDMETSQPIGRQLAEEFEVSPGGSGAPPPRVGCRKRGRTGTTPLPIASSSAG